MKWLTVCVDSPPYINMIFIISILICICHTSSRLWSWMNGSTNCILLCRRRKYAIIVERYIWNMQSRNNSKFSTAVPSAATFRLWFQKQNSRGVMQRFCNWANFIWKLAHLGVGLKTICTQNPGIARKGWGGSAPCQDFFGGFVHNTLRALQSNHLSPKSDNFLPNVCPYSPE